MRQTESTVFVRRCHSNVFNWGSIFSLSYWSMVALWCSISLCKITQLEKQDNRKCIFATDGILEQNSVRRPFQCVPTVTCLIMAVPHWCFCGVQWLFIHVIYIKCLGFWLQRKDSWEKKFRPPQWWPILDLAQMSKKCLLISFFIFTDLYDLPTLSVYLAPGGYSTLSCVRMCGPRFRPPPYN